VRHSYRDGWYFPGGGVKKWETLEQAAIRETREEGGAEIEALDGLYGMYANFNKLKCDHVGLFVARRWRPVPLDSLEIVEARFFPVRDLPEGTTAPTRRRVAEFLGQSPRSGLW
jgi:8-oxo-dGTP pyrophosphatase MutT (NUDIX family)